MTNDYKAPADFRFLIRDTYGGYPDHSDPASLGNVNTVPLPDGAMCLVTVDQSLWVLDKTSSATPITGEIVSPIAGPGRWVRFAVSMNAGPAYSIVGTDFNSFAATGNWGATSDSHFASDTPASAAWTLTPTGGILTYTGPAKRFLVTLAASVRVGDASSPRDVFLGISKSNDLTGAPSAGTSGQIEAVIATAAASVSMATNRVVDLVSGDTLRIKVAAPAGASSASLMPRLSITP